MDVSDHLFSEAPPGVSPRKWARLASFLGALPPAAASRLFAAFEAGGGEGLPRGAMLDVLRTRLISESAGFPPRKMSAQRLFFRPFEDFFISGRRGRKRRARIDRASLSPIWGVLTADAACAAAARDLDAALSRGEDAAAFESALFAAASEGLSTLVAHADEDAAFRADLSARLGGPANGSGAAALHDLAELSLLLPAARHFVAAQETFARPLAAIGEKELYAVRRIYARAAIEAPQAAAYVLTAIAGRMDAPWRAMRIHYDLMRAADLPPHARADAAAIAATLFDDLEGLARGLERDADDDPDTDYAPARFSHFAEFADGMAEEARREGDGAAESRVEACRDIAAAALARFAETALAAVRRHHPARPAGGSSRLMALRPDIARPIDRAAERDAREAARFLSLAPALGEKLGRKDAVQPIVADAIAETRRYAGDLVAEIRAAEGAERTAAKQRMEATLRAAGGLLPDDEIALLKERANAAAVSA